MQIKSYTEDQKTALESELEALTKDLVPLANKAETVHGEILRAVNRIAYRMWNDGMSFFININECSCAEAAAYLHQNHYNHFGELLEYVVKQQWLADHPRYPDAIAQLTEIAIDLVKSSENRANTIDMWTCEPVWNYAKCEDCDDLDEPQNMESNFFGGYLCSCCHDSRQKEEEEAEYED